MFFLPRPVDSGTSGGKSSVFSCVGPLWLCIESQFLSPVVGGDLEKQELVSTQGSELKLNIYPAIPIDHRFRCMSRQSRRVARAGGHHVSLEGLVVQDTREIVAPAPRSGFPFEIEHCLPAKLEQRVVVSALVKCTDGTCDRVQSCLFIPGLPAASAVD